MKSMNLIGYDLDGVICRNSPKRKKPFFKQTGAERKEYQEERLIHFKNVEVKLKPMEEFIIITARKLKEKVVTLEWLKKNNLNPKEVYFLEGTKTRENIIKYKAGVINKNKLEKYYDDDEKICKKLVKLCPNTIIENVKGG
jgi:hypothetical protein